MKKLKLFISSNTFKLPKDIEEWQTKEKPIILKSKLRTNKNGYAILVTYDDGKGAKITLGD